MRDETLQRMMSEAVEGIDPRPEDSLRRVIGRGSRRRAGRWAVIGAAVGVFVAVVAGTAVSMRDSTGEPANPGVGDQRLRPVLVDRFPVGPRGQSTALTAGGGYLWVAAYGIGGEVDEGVMAVDPGNGKVKAIVPAPIPSWETGGGGLTYAFGSVWVGGRNRDGGVVTRIDPVTLDVVARIPMPGGRGPAGGVADLDAASASLWVALMGGGKDGGRVVRINGTTNEVTGAVELPQETARRIVATDEVVIAQGWGRKGGSPQNYYNSIDPNSMELRGTFDSGVFAGPAPGIVEHDGSIWGQYRDSSDRYGIARLDPITAEPVADRTLFAPDHFPRSFVISGDGGIWFGAYPGGSGGSGDNLSFLDTDTHAIYSYGKGGGTPAMLDGDLWFLDYEGTLSRYDLVPGSDSSGGGDVEPPADWNRLSSYRGMVISAPKSWRIFWSRSDPGGPHEQFVLSSWERMPEPRACPIIPAGETAIYLSEETPLPDGTPVDPSYYPPRPPSFSGLAPEELQFRPGCTEPRVARVLFTDRGRYLYTHVLFGAGTTEREQRVAASILDTLEVRPADATRTYTSSARWEWDYPYAPWHMGGGRKTLHDDGEYYEYHWVSNLYVVDGRAAFINGGVIDDFDALSPDSVVLELWGFGRDSEWEGEPDTPLPVTVDVAPGGSETVTVYDQGRRFELTLTANPYARGEDVATAVRVLESLRFTEGAEFRGGPWSDSEGITSALVPVGWKVAHGPLTPRLVEPHEIASFGTAAVMFNSGAMCSQLPTRAAVLMGEGEALVQVRERTSFGDGYGEPPTVDADTRPEHFHLDEMAPGGDWPFCVSPGRGASVWTDSFEQNGRQIHVLVVMGERAARNHEQRAKVEALLDSLIIEPGLQIDTAALSPPSPCSLMDQVTAEDMLSIRIGDVRPVEPHEWKKQPEPWPAGHVGCRYTSDGRLGEVIVALRLVSREEFKRVFLNHPANDHIVKDLGDIATWSGCGGVHAWQDGVLVQVGVQYSDCDIKRPLIELTRTALERA